LEQYWQHLNNLEIPDSIDLNEQPSVKRIIDASQRLLQKQINNKGSIDRNQLIQFCRDLVGDLVPLFNAAAIAQLNKMHEIVQGWINEHNIDRQDSSFKVILIGARTARQNNIQATYFERLLGVERQKHIAYIEEIFNNELRVFSIFSTWFLDEQIGVTFFNDQDRMHRDLLMNDHVRQYIEQLIP
jgi:chorismate mutase